MLLLHYVILKYLKMTYHKCFLHNGRGHTNRMSTDILHLAEQSFDLALNPYLPKIDSSAT